MSNKTINIGIDVDEARRIVNGLHALLVVLGDTRDFPELEYAQEIISEWLIAKYMDRIDMASEVIEALWRLNHVLLEKIEKTGEPLLSDDEIPGKDALEMIRKRR